MHLNQKINHDHMIITLNMDQRAIYDEVMLLVNNNEGQFFFYGHEGTVKINLYETIILRLILEGKIVLVVASSSISTLLLSDRGKIHSKFNIFIEIDENLICDIIKGH